MHLLATPGAPAHARHFVLALTAAILACTAGLAHATTTLRAGQPLSAALQKQAAVEGWTLEWRTGEDYFLDADLEVPGKDVVSDLFWVLDHYRKSGGMRETVVMRGKGNALALVAKPGASAEELDPALARIQGAVTSGNALTFPALT